MRVIAKLDIKNQNLIKSVRYDGVKIIGDPYLMARKLYQKKIDEIFLVNITGTLYDYNNFKKMFALICESVFIPVTIGGGIKSLEDCESYFSLGADKISLNSILFEKPELLKNLASIYGSQSVTVTVQAKYINNDWFAFKDMGRENTGIKVKDWVHRSIEEGAGEIILISVDDDGLCRGLNYQLLKSVGKIKVPLILSGGFNHEIDTVLLGMQQIEGICISNYFYKNEIDIKKIKNLV